MTMTVQRAWNSLRRRVTYSLHPRAIRWKYLKKHAPGQGVITRLGKNLKVRVYPHDVIGKHIYIEGVFEPVEWRFTEGYLQPGMTVLDLGANLGQYTLLAAHRVGATGRVHSFEPSQRMFDELNFNVSLNGLSERCVLNHAAVSDRAGHANLMKCPPGHEVYGSLGAGNRLDLAETEYEQVRTLQLDDYVAEQGIERVDFIKIDIEGAELLALKGATALLTRSDAPAILIELADINTKGFGYHAVEIWDWLADLGYRMYSLEGGVHGLEPIERPADFTSAMNVVAIKNGAQSKGA